MKKDCIAGGSMKKGHMHFKSAHAPSHPIFNVYAA